MSFRSYKVKYTFFLYFRFFIFRRLGTRHLSEKIWHSSDVFRNENESKGTNTQNDIFLI